MRYYLAFLYSELYHGLAVSKSGAWGSVLSIATMSVSLCDVLM